jgi:hypothetical protein
MDVGEFWLRVFDALQRVVAVLIFAAVHHYLSVAVDQSLPSGSDWDVVRKLAQAINATLFVSLDAYLAFDMLAVFVPWIKGRDNR